jgi:hypothetical protein
MKASMTGDLNLLMQKIKTKIIIKTLTKIHIFITLLKSRWKEKTHKKMSTLIKMLIWMSSQIQRMPRCSLAPNTSQLTMGKGEQEANLINTLSKDNPQATSRHCLKEE